MLVLREKKGGNGMNLFFVFLGIAAWQDLRTRRISLDVLAENYLPALPISPAGAANLFIQSLTTCRQGLTQNGQSQGLSRQYPSDRTSFASILPRVLPVHPGCSACLHPVSARRSLCQAEALDGDDDNANPRSRYSTNI